MILAGAALGAFVYLAWPEPTFTVVRLPYGESMPKTPALLVERAETVRTLQAAPAQEKPAREPAAVVRAPAAVADDSEPAAPAPATSEPDDGYVESPEQLGATPLPGMGDPAEVSPPGQQPAVP